MKTKFLLLITLLCFLSYVGAQSISFNNSFANQGVFTYTEGSSNEDIVDMKILNDNSIIALGNTNFDPDEGGNTRSIMFKLLPNGQYDNSFGINGRVYIDTPSSSDYGNKLGLQSNGKILVAGFTGNAGAIYRFNTNGTLDTSFGVQGKATNSEIGESNFRNMYVNSDNKIIVSGSARISNRYGCLVAKFNANGIKDTSFGNGSGFTTIRSNTSSSREDTQAGWGLDIQPDGKILTCGYDESHNGVACRFNSNGSIDSGFGLSGFYILTKSTNRRNYYSNIYFKNDRIYICGAESKFDNSDFKIRITKLLINGNLDNSFGPGGSILKSGTSISDILFYDDGHILATTWEGIVKINSSTGEFMWSPDIIFDITNKFSNNEFTFTNTTVLKNNKAYVCGTNLSFTDISYTGFIIGLNINNTTSTKDGNSITEIITIYPNPTSDIITIEGNVEKIEIFNITGHKVSTSYGTKYDDHTTFDVSTLPKGVYMMSGQNTDGIFKSKFIKI